VVAHIHFTLVRYAYRAEIMRRPGARNPFPPNGYYHCKDGSVFISLFQPHHWDRLVDLMGDANLSDPAFRDRDHRQQHAELVNTRVQAFAAGFERWALTEALQARGIPAAPLSTVADLASNVHLAARRFFRDFTQPPYGQLRTTGPLFRASASPLRIHRPAPRVGEPQAAGFETTSVTSDMTPRVAFAQPQRALPLAGIRILDFSRVWAGPYGTRYLADFGAEVIKVESGQFPDGRRPDLPDFAEINRNKRSITLNFQTPEGLELSKRLVAVSDVVVENFSPRVMAKYGLDYPRLQEVKPDLIMVSMPGFGHSGPHGAFASYGGPLMAYTGMALLWGYDDSPPDAHCKLAYPDYIAAGTCALAILTALHHRARTGAGQFLEIAQVEATAAAIEPAFLDYFANGTVAAARGNRDPNRAPQGCYPCLGHDAWCVVSCHTDAQWHALAQIIGGPDLMQDVRFASLSQRWQQHDVLDALISAWTQAHTPHQVMHLLQAVGVPAGAVQTGEDLWRDPHLRARDYMLTLTHADAGRAEHPGLPVRLHGTPGQIRRPAGRLGEANEAVFCELLGLSASEFTRLVQAGVIA
jgi:crotonobetainyl-CoA:carnitine CoA-transferase CaiB-like acyl-CoA transferase